MVQLYQWRMDQWLYCIVLRIVVGRLIFDMAGKQSNLSRSSSLLFPPSPLHPSSQLPLLYSQYDCMASSSSSLSEASICRTASFDSFRDVAEPTRQAWAAGVILDDAWIRRRATVASGVAYQSLPCWRTGWYGILRMYVHSRYIYPSIYLSIILFGFWYSTIQ